MARRVSFFRISLAKPAAPMLRNKMGAPASGVESHKLRR